LEVADLLLKQGAGVDTKDNHNKRPLETALDGKNLGKMRFLLEHGARTNTRDRFNKRPLETAYHRGNLPAIKLLLECGADADLRDTYDWTPLHYASYHGQLDIVRLLLKYGADVDSKARKTLDWTPLHGASSQGHLTIVQELVDGGADVYAQDAAQHTPISIALRTGRSGVVELLREYIRDQAASQPSPEQLQWHHRAMEILSENDIDPWWVVAIAGLSLMWLIQKISYFVTITVIT
jgi:ankyrin repeat protein